jgi:hypothetical protein
MRSYTMRPVVFLDMDDVLCLSDQFGSREMLKIMRREVPDRSELWARLVDADAALNLYQLHMEFRPWYVISSSWASYLDHSQMCQALTRTGLQFVVDNLHTEWCTPRALSSSRCDEIEWWLDSHHEPEQPFLVIDDSYSGTRLAYSPLALDGHVVLCRSGFGFTKKRLKEARYQLQRQLPDENALGLMSKADATKEKVSESDTFQLGHIKCGTKADGEKL